jgi:hypothetical protein
MEKEQLIKLIDERITTVLKTGAFTKPKLTDIPTDALQVVSRKYVTLNGVSASRPTASVLGQFYFDTSINKPVWWNGTSFVDATGTTV